MFRFRDGPSGSFKPQGRMKTRERTRVRRDALPFGPSSTHRGARPAGKTLMSPEGISTGVQKSKVDAQEDRGNRTRAATDARERETLEFRADARRLGIPPRGKPFSKSERRDLRTAKAKDPALYLRKLAQYSDPTRR